ncbi:MAG: hypothetical protein LUP94_02870, partial [Candidatus Methanomethylicus sp.]|nr:hypothetical protein [Candidatus Methanomethylicus sp.]
NENNLNEQVLEKKINSAIEVGKILGTDPILVTCGKRPRESNITILRIDEINKLEKAKDLESLVNSDDYKKQSN